MKLSQWFKQYLLLIAALVFTIATEAVSKEGSSATSFYSNFEELSFTDQDSHAYQIAKLSGKVTLFNFIYTQCSSVCPLQTKALQEIQQSLPPETGKDVQFISVSLDPLNDTPQKLNAYAKRMHADLNHWSFITGKPESIEKIANRLSLYGNPVLNEDKKVVRPNDHSTALWLINRKGELMMRYSGNPLDTQRISKELTQLSKM